MFDRICLALTIIGEVFASGFVKNRVVEFIGEGIGNLSVDYRIGIGYVEIQVTNSDFYYPSDANNNLIKPEAMVFHLQLIY